MSRRAVGAGARRAAGRVVLWTLAAAAFWVCGAREARADAVGLTGGGVSIDCSVPANSREATIDLSGQDFSLHMFVSGFGVNPCGSFPVTFSLNTTTTPFDFVISNVTYQGVSTMFMTGSLTFDQGTISGFVIGRPISDFSAQLFRVDFTGTGVGTIGGGRASFNVATPEPATILLLGTGLAAATLSARRRRKGAGRRAASRDE